VVTGRCENVHIGEAELVGFVSQNPLNRQLSEHRLEPESSRNSVFSAVAPVAQARVISAFRERRGGVVQVRVVREQAAARYA
jgi:hypothetical protein